MSGSSGLSGRYAKALYELAAEKKIISIKEKPKTTKSNLAINLLYLYKRPNLYILGKSTEFSTNSLWQYLHNPTSNGKW